MTLPVWPNSTTRNHRNTAPMVRRVPAYFCRQPYCSRNSLGRRKAILLHFSLMPEGNKHYYDKRATSFRMGARDRIFTRHRRPIIRYRGWNILLLVCYDLRSRSGSAIRAMNTTSWIYCRQSGPFLRRRKSGDICCARAGKHQLRSAVSTVSARTVETFYTAERSVVYSPKGGEVLATVS